MTHSEAPASLNFKVVTEKGYDVQFTLRDESEANLLKRFAALVLLLEEKHVRPPGSVFETVIKKIQNVTAQAALLEPPDPWQGDLPALSDVKIGDDEFQADKLVGAMLDGKVYWKVKGGRFSKFGVTIWPEALKESGIDPSKLSVEKEYPIKDMTAHYVNKEGKPEKVVLLSHNEPT
jgi:hypothetical protein